MFGTRQVYTAPSRVSRVHQVSQLTCEPTGLGQQEGAPRHEEEERRLQQRETVQLRKLGDVGAELKTQLLYSQHP